MAAACRKSERTTLKKSSRSVSIVPRRKGAYHSATPLAESRLIRTLQQRLLDIVSSSEEEGRSLAHRPLGGLRAKIPAVDESRGDRRLRARRADP